MKSIIWRMKQVLDVYRYLKVVQKRADELDEENKGADLIKYMDNWQPKISDTKECFKTKYSVGQNFVNGVFDDAQKWGYIDIQKKTIPNSTYELETFVTVNHEGRRLLDRVPFLPFVPTGLFMAWWKHDGLLVKSAMTVIISAIGYLGTHIVISLIKRWI